MNIAFLVALSVTTPPDTATFAGGCFWTMEHAYDDLPGVISATSGFMGGTTKNPSYIAVVEGNTGHLESVQVVYDPAKVSYETLLWTLWHNIDTFQADGQACDTGPKVQLARQVRVGHGVAELHAPARGGDQPGPHAPALLHQLGGAAIHSGRAIGGRGIREIPADLPDRQA